jgi:hypothetical protein
VLLRLFTYFATVYAGVQPTEQQKQEHMKDLIGLCLHQLADLAHNKEGEPRVQALFALSELHGITTQRVASASAMVYAKITT